MTGRNKLAVVAALAIALAIFAMGCPKNQPGGQPSTGLPDVTLLNVSYDPTRELYEEYNSAFQAHWKTTTGQNVTINQSHAGSVLRGMQGVLESSRRRCPDCHP